MVRLSKAIITILLLTTNISVAKIILRVKAFGKFLKRRVGFLTALFALLNIYKKEENYMIIKKKRINSEKYFATAVEDKPVFIKVDNVLRFADKLKIFGFDEKIKDGTCILPNTFNRSAEKNAEAYCTINRKLPKEKYTQTIYWTRQEWAGYNETREVSDFVDIPRERYHRDWHLPYSVYFTYVEAEEPYIISDEIIYNKSNVEKLMNTVNMVLGLFGECTIDGESLPDKIKKIHLDWEILPTGKYPWTSVKPAIEEITHKCKITQKEMMLRNCQVIVDMEPEFVAYGRSGFRGYAVFGFTKKNLYVLESIFPNNATYIFDNNWEELSKLTKAEILSGGLQKERIIHSANWPQKFKKVMEEIK